MSSLTPGLILTIFGVSVTFVYLALVMGFLGVKKNKFPVNGRTVIITGGSSGMGLSLAKILAQKGANVIIVARDKIKLNQAIESIKALASSPNQRFHIISADVTSSEENIRILSEATQWNNGSSPDIFWANAGGAHPSLFVDTSIETLRQQMDVNYWSAAYFCHATLNLLLRRRPSCPPSSVMPKHIILTSSVIAFIGLAGYSPYCPAKAAMRSLADSLRNEIEMYNGARRHFSSSLSSNSENNTTILNHDIKIHLVLPGSILTPGFETENVTKPAVTHLLEESDPKQTPDQVAIATFKGLERGQYMITTNWLGELMRGGMLGVSPRDKGFIRDGLLSGIANVIWGFVGRELDAKVYKWGKQNASSLFPTTKISNGK